MKSIIQHEKKCYECGRSTSLQLHHCIHGTANRKHADYYGLTVYLCYEHHRELHDRNNEMDRRYMQLAQNCYEATHGNRNDFIKVFGKSYL